ncbi:gliding motility-associated C-terminal domain-containing protein [Filimonas lacunae]|uniref:Gliding motility-associated C-terminal domain-containing protein n=1 Tax=Filimonas lacunae TaxID=477680 RepID=A0A173MFQ8_9BACT|nr:gliding motility-associated C-terminal domain-containing protein [Filimonas lacunae]BAV06271.1 CHU large protein [Filimonas lacunae]SIT25579.1 gliding motility-associated C-terminal domain-containing protein [Filimonas lacunae]
MKYRLFILLIVFCKYSFITARAQCSNGTTSPSASITGGPCTGIPITFTGSTTPNSLQWYNGSSLVNTVAATTTSATVAGGNGAGSALNQLNYPCRIWVDAAGTLYVPDKDNYRIVKWLQGAVTGSVVMSGYYANLNGGANCVMLDKQGNLFAINQIVGAVLRLPAGGNPDTDVETLSASYALWSPTDLYVDDNGDLYVSDQDKNAVFKFSKSSGYSAFAYVVVAGNNGSGSANNQFGRPTGIYVDADGNVYVCDTDNSRVMKWAPGAVTGVVVAGSNSGSGSDATRLYNPLDVFVDCGGNMFIADYNNNRIQKWAKGATSGVTVAGGNGRGSASNQLNGPIGVFVDTTGAIYVSEVGNNRVQKFTSTINNTFTPSTPGKYVAVAAYNTGSLTTDTLEIKAPGTVAVSVAADTTVVCASGGFVSYQAQAINGGSSPVYQWSKNGMVLSATTAVYADNNALPGDKVFCTLTSNEVCVAAATVNSNVIAVTAYPVVNLELGPDISICPGTTTTLSAATSYPFYEWQNGSGLPQQTVTDSGKYYLTVKDICNRAFSDTVRVSLYAVASQVLPDDTTICSYDRITLTSIIPLNSRVWQTNSTAASIDVSAGVYWLTGKDMHNCTVKDTIWVYGEKCLDHGMYMPTAFTPDHDGKNDVFRPVFSGKVSQYRFSVYNRYGQQVFTSTQLNQGWDGTFKGSYSDMNVYVWVCQYQLDGGPLQVEKGTVTLLR